MHLQSYSLWRAPHPWHKFALLPTGGAGEAPALPLPRRKEGSSAGETHRRPASSSSVSPEADRAHSHTPHSPRAGRLPGRGLEGPDVAHRLRLLAGARGQVPQAGPRARLPGRKPKGLGAWGGGGRGRLPRAESISCPFPRPTRSSRGFGVTSPPSSAPRRRRPRRAGLEEPVPRAACHSGQPGGQNVLFQ